MECMASCGTPTSTVAMPSSAAVMGPMVLPQPKSERVTKDCTGTTAWSHRSRKRACVALLEA